MSAFADIAVVIPSAPREPECLTATLANLRRGGLYASPRLYDTRHPLIALDPGHSLLPCENAGRALLLGAISGAPWVLYLEDDIDVCAGFLDGVGAWLDEHVGPPEADPYRVFAFGAAYTPQLEDAVTRGLSAWPYPVDAFYGTQAIALRAADARSLGEYWQSNPKVRGVTAPGQYDLMLQDWLQNRYLNGRILAAAPSHVQHTGRVSTLRPADSPYEPPVFDSWRGREWRYTPRVTSAIVLPGR